MLNIGTMVKKIFKMFKAVKKIFKAVKKIFKMVVEGSFRMAAMQYSIPRAAQSTLEQKNRRFLEG